MKRTLLFRSFSVFLALVMAFTASAEGLRLAAATTYDWVRIATQSEPEEFNETPPAPETPLSNGRSESRDGMWTWPDDE